MLGWRDGSVVKGTYCSSRGLGPVPSTQVGHKSGPRIPEALCWPLWVLHSGAPVRLPHKQVNKNEIFRIDLMLAVLPILFKGIAYGFEL